MRTYKNKNQESVRGKMTKREKIAAGILLVIICLVVLGVFVSAQEVSFCCEKTLTGAYCQNEPEENCDANFKVSPTSCEATSYCKKGCCYDSDEGICMENTPEEACSAANGSWEENANCQIPRCNMGCCLLGTEAAYVTLQRCKKLSGIYGLQTNFRTDVADELSCIALATSQDFGACVFESEFVKTCRFGTRDECDSAELGEQVSDQESIRFYKDYLCTAEELETDCAKTQETRCENGRVYFVDTCGNRANIYDASKLNSAAYWTKIKHPEESCHGSPRGCGNCEYLGQGTICAEALRGQKPAYGDYICQDVNCYDTSNGEDYKNGESWCYYDNGNQNADSVGSRHYRHICYMGEEIVEPCGDFRNEVCVEDAIETEGEDFSQAGCIVNRWQDCILQNKTRDCLNRYQRDCIWLPIDEKGRVDNAIRNMLDIDTVKAELFNVQIEDQESYGKCVPKVAPGLDFWSENAQDVCMAGTQTCIVKYEKRAIGGEKKCVENCFCDPDNPESKKTALAAMFYCSSLGDCGPGANYVGKFVNEGYEIKIKGGKETQVGDEREEAPQSQSQEFGGAQQTGEETFRGSQPAGNVVQGMIIKAYNFAKGS